MHVQIAPNDDEISVDRSLDDDRAPEDNQGLRDDGIAANEILGGRRTNDGVRTGERRDENFWSRSRSGIAK
jgi:hypothetical protein